MRGRKSVPAVNPGLQVEHHGKGVSTLTIMNEMYALISLAGEPFCLVAPRKQSFGLMFVEWIHHGPKRGFYVNGVKRRSI